MSFEIEELTRLIEEEKAAEDRIKDAEAEASRIRDEAEKKAREILRNAESGGALKELESETRREIDKKKNALTKRHKRRVEKLNEMAESKFDETISMVVEDVLEVEL